MHHPRDRITHTTALVTPVVEYWLKREIAQCVHHEGWIRRPIAPWLNEVPTELHLAPVWLRVVSQTSVSNVNVNVIVIYRVRLLCKLNTNVSWFNAECVARVSVGNTAVNSTSSRINIHTKCSFIYVWISANKFIIDNNTHINLQLRGLYA